jgi:hypothetical protein
MRVRDAKAAARQWILEQVGTLPSFHGAFLTGSITSAPDDAVFPPTSDVDVKIVMDAPPDTGGPEKFVAHGTILDVSYAPSDDVRSPEVVLGNYYTAVHFVWPSILLDPSGNLSAIHQVVAREYPRRIWVRRRSEHARSSVEDVLTWLNPTAPIHDQVFTLLLALALSSHVVLVADLKNPTIRKCLVVLKDVLTAYCHESLHERVLGILGSASMDRRQVDSLLTSCVEAFDAAIVVRSTPFPYASNIAAFARPIAIEGSRELIISGHHREAMVWLATIHTWCQTVLHNDAPDEVRSRLTPAYQRLLSELGVASYVNVAGRMEQVGKLLPDLWQVAEEVIATNPAIQD